MPLQVYGQMYRTSAVAFLALLVLATANDEQPPSPPMLSVGPRPPLPPAPPPRPPQPLATFNASRVRFRITFFGLDMWSILTWNSDVTNRANASILQGLTAPSTCFSQLLAMDLSTLLNSSDTTQQLLPGLFAFKSDVEVMLREYLNEDTANVTVPDFCAGNRTQAAFYGGPPLTLFNQTWPTVQVQVELDANPAWLATLTALGGRLGALNNLQRNCPPPPSPSCPDPCADPNTNPPCTTCIGGGTIGSCNCDCFPAAARLRVLATACPGESCAVDPADAAMAAAKGGSNWQDTALEDLLIGDAVECLVPVGQGHVDAQGGRHNTAYQLDVCRVYYYSHAVRAVRPMVQLTYTRADGSNGSLEATPHHTFFVPNRPAAAAASHPTAQHSPGPHPTHLQLPQAAAVRAAPQPSAELLSGRAADVVRAGALAGAPGPEDSQVLHVAGSWITFRQVRVGDLVLLREPLTSQLYTAVITHTASVERYGNLNPLLTKQGILVLEGAVVPCGTFTHNTLMYSAYEAAFLQHMAATGQATNTLMPDAHIRAGAHAAPRNMSLLWGGPEQVVGQQGSSLNGRLALAQGSQAVAHPATLTASPALPLTALTALDAHGPQPAPELLPLWHRCLEHSALSPHLAHSWLHAAPHPQATPLLFMQWRRSNSSAAGAGAQQGLGAPDAVLDLHRVAPALQPWLRLLLANGCTQLGMRLGDAPQLSSMVALSQAVAGQQGPLDLARLRWLLGGLHAAAGYQPGQGYTGLSSSSQPFSLLDVIAAVVASGKFKGTAPGVAEM
ncbi:hypothetical protein QJQ45_011719 [Haematococcus lacustris]|nr:hypothetical protein QJQ45_011719 [Haematococcus lacustris]